MKFLYLIIIAPIYYKKMNNIKKRKILFIIKIYHKCVDKNTERC